MPINLWTKEEDELLKSRYKECGTNISKELGRSKKAIIDRAYILGIKTKVIKKIYYCSNCGIEFKNFNKERNKSHSYRPKSGLCKKCVAKVRYTKRGSFSHNNSKMWSNQDIEFLINNYYELTRKELETNLNRKWNSIYHKASRLKIYRNPKFLKEGNAKGREYFKINNPMSNPEMASRIMGSFSRLKMTSIEKKVAKFLDSLNIKYEFNKGIKAKRTFKFPDFTIDKLIIECDGEHWHENKKEYDLIRQRELEEMGYKVIRFSGEQINKNFEEVKRCILLELNQ